MAFIHNLAVLVSISVADCLHKLRIYGMSRLQHALLVDQQH